MNISYRPREKQTHPYHFHKGNVNGATVCMSFSAPKQQLLLMIFCYATWNPSLRLPFPCTKEKVASCVDTLVCPYLQACVFFLMRPHEIHLMVQALQ